MHFNYFMFIALAIVITFYIAFRRSKKFLRFVAGRIKDRRPNGLIFSEIYRKGIWGPSDDGFFSGFGSHADSIVNSYIAALGPVLARYPDAGVTDFGCGDFNVGQHLAPLCKTYIACDVVPELIERNKRLFANIDFRCLDITTDDLPTGDIAIVRQVLQHLSNRQIAAFLTKLQGYEVLILTEHLPSGVFQPNADKAPGAGIRLHGLKPSGVIVTEPPFNLNCRSSEILAENPESKSVVRTTAYYEITVSK